MPRVLSAKLSFGPWSPDLPVHEAPGATAITSMIPVDGHYQAFRGMASIGAALSAAPLGAFQVSSSNSARDLYAGTTTTLQAFNYGAGTWTDYSPSAYSASTTSWRFAQYNDYVIATNRFNVPQFKDTTGVSNFANLASSGTASNARVIGVIGQFVVLGDITGAAVTGPHAVHWCSIDDPRSWPTINSATALSTQSGAQELNSNDGPVTGVVQGDQFGLVFQASSVTRMTYVGGNTVFQFDRLEAAIGTPFIHGQVTVGGLTYYPSPDGFFVTDGTVSKGIGDKQVDKYFASSIDHAYKHKVVGAVDSHNKIIRWVWPNSSATSGRPNKGISFNYADGRWAPCDAESELVYSLPSGYTRITGEALGSMRGFTTDFRPASFTATASAYTIESQEIELVPRSRTVLLGVKPIIDGYNGGTVSITIGTRNNHTESVTWGSASSSVNPAGFVDFRSSARFHRVRISNAAPGNSEKIIGAQILYAPSDLR